MSNLIKSKSKVIETDEEKIFVKETNKDIKELFEYLNSRSFNNIPSIIDVRDESVKYKYIEQNNINNPNIHLELAKIISLLHYKTAYFKDVSKNKYREIYDKLSDKIEFISNYYIEMIERIEMEIYPSPAHYLIERNYGIINGSVNYAKRELKNWFKLVENKTKERVVVVHNNPKVEHLINGEFLTNWDNYVVDTPILDLYKLYKEPDIFNDYLNVYKEYNKNFSLLEEEKKLFFILISIPPKIEEIDNELLNTKNIRSIINKIYKTNDLIAAIDFKNKEDNKSN